MNQGERVSGRYKIIKKIGAGGMANVYLATDLILEREVAVKMMSLDFQEDKDSLRRFQREALSTTELTHPNIVNIYDVGEGDQPYIVMEHVDGMDLKQYIRENHPIPYQKAIDIMEQILNGIAYAHKNDVIHRDIKPHNILIDKDGNIKITDFGIAVALSQNSITQTNSLLGSVQYISPEQARGNVVTKQSDIYSLGIVLYELLTGTVPFEGESAVSIALKHFQTPIPSLREFDSRLPQPLENVVLKATAKEPRHRYATVDEMKEDLLTALSPSRRDEKKFVPPAENEEDTLVLDVNAINSEASVATAAPISDETINLSNEEEAAEKTQPQPKKKRRWLWLLIPLILIGVFLAFLLSRPVQVVIPENLVGMTQEEATERLEEVSLKVGEIIEQSNDEYEEGIVFRVNPNEGASVLEESEVDLYVSLGEEPFEVEDYAGENYEEIRAELTEAGFTVESEEASDETVPEGDIIEQSITPGEEVLPRETTITFTVSTGRRIISMIDLTGYSREQVNNFVDENSLNLSTTSEPSDDVPADQVIRQEPEEGSTLFIGDRINVVFSTGPEEEEEPETVTFSKEVTVQYEENLSEPENEDEEPEALPNRIEIFVNDLNQNGESAVHSFTLNEGETVTRGLTFTVEEGQTASYRIERDGEVDTEEVVSSD
jgi:serine/threonine-protein kinase